MLKFNISDKPVWFWFVSGSAKTGVERTFKLKKNTKKIAPKEKIMLFILFNTLIEVFICKIIALLGVFVNLFYSVI